MIKCQEFQISVILRIIKPNLLELRDLFKKKSSIKPTSVLISNIWVHGLTKPFSSLLFFLLPPNNYIFTYTYENKWHIGFSIHNFFLEDVGIFFTNKSGESLPKTSCIKRVGKSSFYFTIPTLKYYIGSTYGRIKEFQLSYLCICNNVSNCTVNLGWNYLHNIGVV